MTRFLLIRHGQSQANLDHVFGGNTDYPLTALGHRQAEVTARFIADNYPVDAIYASPLSRAYSTAEHASTLLKLPVRTDHGLREIFAGAWEGQSFDELSSCACEEYQNWMHDIGRVHCPGGESVAELAERVWDSICRIAREEDGKTVLVVTHATPIRTLQWRMTGEDISYMKTIPWVSNSSLTELCWEDGRLTPVRISMDDHLQELKTTLPANV